MPCEDTVPHNLGKCIIGITCRKGVCKVSNNCAYDMSVILIKTNLLHQ